MQQSIHARPQVHAAPAPLAHTGDATFERSRFLLRQKHLSLNEKYFVWDENGQKLLFVERPAHHLRRLLSILGAMVAFVVGLFPVVLVADLLPEPLRSVGLAVVAPLVAFSAAFAAGVALSVKRHVFFYRDETKRELLLKVEQDRKFSVIRATYTIKDPLDSVLGTLSKNYLYNVIRKRWNCASPFGDLVCVIKEDSLVLSIARRLLGPLFGLLRTNFVFLNGAKELGRLNRQFTLLDRYVLDVSRDTEGVLDRRVALAIGVMLDTGERR